jgi:nicotinate-nucleotide pyrophosphorylase
MAIIHDDEWLAILRDDCPYSDITTEGLSISDIPARLRMTARNDMVVCGVEEAARMLRLAGAPARHAVADNVEDALLLGKAGADVLQVDKFTPEQVSELRARIPSSTTIFLDVAGGVNASNAETYAEAGTDVLVTSAPYYRLLRDVKVTFAKA